MDIGQLKVDIALDIGHWTLDIGHWTVDIGQLTVDTGGESGHLKIDTGQWTWSAQPTYHSVSMSQL